MSRSVAAHWIQCVLLISSFVQVAEVFVLGWDAHPPPAKLFGQVILGSDVHHIASAFQGGHLESGDRRKHDNAPGED